MTTPEAQLKRANQVIQAYGESLVRLSASSTAHLHLKPLSSLPYEKAVIKSALLVALNWARQNQDDAYENALVEAYLSLAHFQNIPANMAKMPAVEPLKKGGTRPPAASEMAKALHQSAPHIELAIREAVRCREELRQHGFWADIDDEQVSAEMRQLVSETL